jgi:hypothetical protein
VPFPGMEEHLSSKFLFLRGKKRERKKVRDGSQHGSP